MIDETIPALSGGGLKIRFGLAILIATAIAVAIGLGACGGESDSGPPAAESDTHARSSEYVGAQACAGCHEEQSRRWAGSHHDLAMQDATADTKIEARAGRVTDVASLLISGEEDGGPAAI